MMANTWRPPWHYWMNPMVMDCNNFPAVHDVGFQPMLELRTWEFLPCLGSLKVFPKNIWTTQFVQRQAMAIFWQWWLPTACRNTDLSPDAFWQQAPLSVASFGLFETASFLMCICIFKYAVGYRLPLLPSENDRSLSLSWNTLKMCQVSCHIDPDPKDSPPAFRAFYFNYECYLPQ